MSASGGSQNTLFSSSMHIDRCDVSMPDGSAEVSTSCGASDWLVAYTLDQQIHSRVIPLTDWNVDALDAPVQLTNDGNNFSPKVASTNDDENTLAFLVTWMHSTPEGQTTVCGTLVDSSGAILSQTNQTTLIHQNLIPYTLSVTFLRKTNQFAIIAQTVDGKGAMSLLDPVTGKVEFTSEESGFYLPFGPPEWSKVVPIPCSSNDEHVAFATAPSGLALVKVSRTGTHSTAQLVQILAGNPTRYVWRTHGTAYVACHGSEMNVLTLANDTLKNIHFPLQAASTSFAMRTLSRKLGWLMTSILLFS